MTGWPNFKFAVIVANLIIHVPISLIHYSEVIGMVLT